MGTSCHFDVLRRVFALIVQCEVWRPLRLCLTRGSEYLCQLIVHITEPQRGDLMSNAQQKEHIMSEPTFSPASALVGDPSQFGRVAEDGVVYVRLPEGERAVGSYPGKTPEEALAYFVRKFEAVASEVALLAARIKSGALVPSDALEAVTKLRHQVASLNGIGDLATLAASVEQIPDLIEGHRAAYEARKEAEKVVKDAKRAEALIIKEKIVSEAESLALSESWKTTGERLKVLLEEWKAAPRLDKAADATLWKRFSASRNKFDKRRRTHFSQLEAASSTVASKKEEIVAEAKKLATSKEWLPTAKSVDLEKRQGTMAENLKKREELILEIEALLPVTDLNSARKKFHDLSEKWFKIGMTERSKRAAFDARFLKVESEIESIQEEQSRRTDPTAIARANNVVQGLLDAIEEYEEKAAKAEAAGNSAKALVAREAAEARKIWLAEAQKGLADFNN